MAGGLTTTSTRGRRNALLLTIGMLVSVVAGCFIVNRAADHLFCGEQTGFTYVSPPNTDYIARVWTRNCGATTGWNTKVILRTGSALFDLPGTYDSDAVLESSMDPRGIGLHWDSATHLIVEYPPDQQGRIRKALPTWKDVTITYRPRGQ